MKKILVLMALACIGIAAAALAAIPGLPPPCYGDIAFDEVMYVKYSGYKHIRDFAIRDEAAWCDFWDQVFSNRYPAPACDASLIDFSQETAIVSAIGWRPNGCYSGRIHCLHSAEHGKWNVDALVLERVPGLNCDCTQAIVTPVHVVKVNRKIGKVTGYHQTLELYCPAY